MYLNLNFWHLQLFNSFNVSISLFITIHHDFKNSVRFFTENAGKKQCSLNFGVLQKQQAHQYSFTSQNQHVNKYLLLIGLFVFEMRSQIYIFIHGLQVEACHFLSCPTPLWVSNRASTQTHPTLAHDISQRYNEASLMNNKGVSGWKSQRRLPDTSCMTSLLANITLTQLWISMDSKQIYVPFFSITGKNFWRSSFPNCNQYTQMKYHFNLNRSRCSKISTPKEFLLISYDGYWTFIYP